MDMLDNYLKLIRERGDEYGGRGGTLDLLIWCKKNSTPQVTLEEARLFYENMDAPYPFK